MSDIPPPPPPSSPPPVPPVPAPPTSVAPFGQIGKLRSIGLTIILTIVTLGIWAFVWVWKNGDELKRYTGRGLGGPLSALITLLLAPIVMFTIPNEIDQMYRAEGRQSPISALWGLWFLLPLIGNLVWYIKVQESVNKFWEFKGQNNTPGV